MSLAIIVISEEGLKIANELSDFFGDCKIIYTKSLREVVGEVFYHYSELIFVMALGIVVRVIAPYIRNKYEDPAVVVVDEKKRFAISALSGHEGGANRLANQVAAILGAEPIVTTRSDSKRSLIVGVGFRKGTKGKEIEDAVRETLMEEGYSLNDVLFISTIDFKGQDRALKEACVSLGLPLRIIPFELVKNFGGSYGRSPFVKEKIGVEGVSEPCALLAGKNTSLVVPKKRHGKVCVAIAKEDLG
ncbi:MAG: cobalamin biosynthesis protein [Desulfobacterota bacterium]|nr:cobalamin biosynthesis protein [Thermodesulfobacteriota bacterium]MDW8001279.1 cobalamin biosynthesis protein [Deltaproteobacteria bacterium]